MISLYGIQNCDSVRKARKSLEMRGIAYEFIDFKSTPADEATIRRWLAHTDLKTLFNTRSTTYRNLKLKAADLSDQEKIEWLAKENMLIKRPVLVTEEKVIIGYNESTYMNLTHT